MVRDTHSLLCDMVQQSLLFTKWQRTYRLHCHSAPKEAVCSHSSGEEVERHLVRKEQRGDGKEAHQPLKLLLYAIGSCLGEAWEGYCGTQMREEHISFSITGVQRTQGCPSQRDKIPSNSRKPSPTHHVTSSTWQFLSSWKTGKPSC